MDRVLKPYTNNKVIHNSHMEQQNYKKKKKLEVELFSCRLGFQAHTVCAALEVGFVGFLCPCSKVCTMGEAPLL